MKKSFVLGIGMVTALLAGCSSEPEEVTSSAASSVDSSSAAVSSEGGEEVYIGILQMTSHPALDLIAEGIMDQLEQSGYVDGETATIDLQNAQGDQSNMQSMAERFIANDADVMIGIATPAAQALANASADIPIVMGAITDPVGAGLVESIEAPGGNITGVSDKTPVRDQFVLMQKILPELDTVGLLYSSSEDNSLSSAQEAEEVAKSLGLETITKTVTSTNDLAQVAESLAADVDAIWVPTDNTVASGMETLIQITDSYQIPVFPAVDTMVEQGGLATVGLNQYALGTQTGAVTVDILAGADPASYAVQYAEGIELVVNQEKADQLQIEIPADIADNAIFTGAQD